MIFKNIFLDTLLLVFIIYFFLGLFLYFTQKSMIYFPSNQNFNECSEFSGYEKINHNNTRFYYKEDSKENVLIFYHGNAGSACDRSYIKGLFEKYNLSIIFVEYAGFSNDNRKPSEKLIFEDVKNVKQFIEEKKFSNVILYGESIGSGPLSYHAYLGDVNSVILVAPFSRLADVGKSSYPIFPVSLMLKDKYDNIKHLSNFKGNVFILHGDNDKIISDKLSKKLFNFLKTENKEYFSIKNNGHNDIFDSKEFKNKLEEILEKI
jgi:uncharacterized protein